MDAQIKSMQVVQQETMSAQVKSMEEKIVQLQEQSQAEVKEKDEKIEQLQSQ